MLPQAWIDCLSDAQGQLMGAAQQSLCISQASEVEQQQLREGWGDWVGARAVCIAFLYWLHMLSVLQYVIGVFWQLVDEWS